MIGYPFPPSPPDDDDGDLGPYIDRLCEAAGFLEYAASEYPATPIREAAERELEGVLTRNRRGLWGKPRTDGDALERVVAEFESYVVNMESAA